MYFIVSCGLCKSNMFFHIISQTARTSEKSIEHEIYFEFLYNIFLQYFSFWEELRRILSTDFRKTIKYQISLKSIQWERSCFNADRKANRHDDANSLFSQFFERAEELHIMQILVSQFPAALSYFLSSSFASISSQYLITKAQIQFRGVSYVFRNGESDVTAGFFLKTLIFPCQLPLTRFSTRIYY